MAVLIIETSQQLCLPNIHTVNNDNMLNKN